jgi:CBS domain-containing protein
MLTDRDVCMAAYTQGRALRDIAVASAMSQHLCTCRSTDAVSVALKVMETNQVRRLPVLDADDALIACCRSPTSVARRCVSTASRCAP